MQIHAEYWVPHSRGTANSATNEDEIIGGKFWTVPVAFTSRYSTSQDRYRAYCRDSITNAASTTEQQLWRQTEQPLNSIEKNNQNNVGHMRLKSSLRKCLRRVFLFRKWTPQCVTFPTNLLSHTQVLKWCKLFPAYHILPQRQQHWHATQKGKQTNPQPKGCNRSVTSTTKSEVCKKTTQGARVTAGRQKGSKERKWEGKAVQEKERIPGKANCLLLFLLFFTFPKLHKLSSKYFLRECHWYKAGYIPLHIQRICNSTKRWLSQTQPILTLCEFQHFCFLWPHILELIQFSLSKGPASSISPNSIWHTAQYKVFFQAYAAKSLGNWRCSINSLFSSLISSKGSGGPILNKNLKAAADNSSTAQAPGSKGECSAPQGCH